MITAELVEDGAVLKVRVRLAATSGESSHEVTLSHRDLARLGKSGETADAFVTRCFEFWLAREPASEIPKRFDISVISDQFAEFEQEIRGVAKA